jgi:hypothetical protein
MHFFQMSGVQHSLVMRRPSRADDANDLVVTFRPNDHDDSLSDRADRDETILDQRMLAVVNLEIVDARPKELSGFFEADAVAALIRQILRIVPRDLHLQILSRWLTRSMA